MIDVEMYGFNCRLTSPVPAWIDKELVELCQYRPEGIDYSDKVKMGEWDGNIRLYRNRRFPVGLLDRIDTAISMMGEDTRVIDRRPNPELTHLTTNWPLRSYQVPIYDDAIERSRGLVQAPTGSGKTVIMSHILAHYGLPSLVVVPATELIDQTLDKMAKVASVMGTRISTSGLAEGVPVGSFSRGSQPTTPPPDPPHKNPEATPGPWFVVTWQTMNSALTRFKGRAAKDERRNMMDFIDQIDVVCCDEVHYAGAEKVYKVMENIPARYRFGFSATPYRTDGADIKMHGAVGDTIKGVSATELIEIGEETDWTEGLVRPIFKWFKPGLTGRYNDGGWQDVYRRYVVENRKRNMILAEKATDLALDEGRITLVMCTQIEHGKILQAMIPDSEFINGTKSPNKRKDMSDRFRAGKIPIMISSAVWNVGVDFPVIEALVMAGPHKSAALCNQRIGRGFRTCPEIGKEDCIVVETIDEARYLSEWSMERLDVYQRESGYIHKGVKLSA